MKQEKYKIGDRDYFYEKFQRFLNEDKLNESNLKNFITTNFKKAVIEFDKNNNDTKLRDVLIDLNLWS